MVRTPSFDKNGMKKGTWTAEEDKKLIAYVTRYGCWNWRQLPRFAGLARCGKSCRLRWLNYLRPDIKRGDYTKEEEEIIVRLHQKLGSRWSVIAANLPGRTDNDIKNHWNSCLKKRFQSKKSRVKHDNEATKPNNIDSGSHRENIQDTDSKQSNIISFFQVTPHNPSKSSVPFSPPLSSSELSTATTDYSSSNGNLAIEEDFDFVNEDIWSESFLAELMRDNGDDTFGCSDTDIQIPDSQSWNNTECSVLELTLVQPAVENSGIEQCVAADHMFHVPNELFAYQSDEYFCPVYHDVEFWNQSNLHDHDIGVGLF